MTGMWLGVSGGMLGAVVMAVTGIVTLIMARGELIRLPPIVFALIVVLGVLNGWGCYKYPKLIQEMGSRGGILIALVAIGILFFSAGLSVPMLGYSPTRRDLLGFTFGVVAIWLLAAK